MSSPLKLVSPIRWLLLPAALVPLLGISDCQSGDADGDGWTTSDGDCDDGDSSVHPGATEACDGIDNDCDDSVDEGYDADCNALGAFTGPVADAPGGMRIMDSEGRLYYSSYTGGLFRVPAGGGVAEQMLTNGEVGGNGLLGNTYVTDDGLVLLDGGAKGVVAYDPSTDTASTYYTVTDAYGYGWSLFVDADDNVGVGLADTVFHPDGTSETVSFFQAYTLITSDWAYTLESSDVYRQRFDGSERELWGSGLSDAYGLAIGADGALYVGQGNTVPSAIFKIPAEGGTAKKFSSVPIAVTAVVSDADGNIYASGWSGNDLYLIDPSTGAATVYGCDPNGCDWK